ncbi:MAG: hypothetical protein COT24_01810 [Candidatus Kerfeldbacteria bacterium CG08_land_8_20_14_0_20_40_16]|uniref:Uncharacterized protein n=1 Tax=Candidatus Kerfeldbacteria bacterium CG08_land_8_20_14_0_20_40_16 TaxID=2014244 RepID=A0A2H0YWF3_9BACT|nr:MAG: hypothetical protein COT24_01810 [Candidatus Kerfeldbacteria bacterium CG08_land_8_20_14_0_20_40_16]
MAELSDKQLKIGIWWVTHKHQLKKWWVILIAVGDVLLFLYLLFNIMIIVFTWSKFTILPYQISWSAVNFKDYQLTNAPKDLQVLNTKYIPVFGQANKYHLLAELKNPNEKWNVGSLDYHFDFDGQNQGIQNTFLLPQEQRFLIQYNVKSTSAKPDPKFLIDNVGWERIERPTEAPSLKFNIGNIESNLIPLLDDKGVETSSYSTRVTAEVENKSVYNFWQVNFQVVLFRGEEPISVGEIQIEKFLALETRNLAVSWKEAYPVISKIVIQPQVNVYDPNALFKSTPVETTPLSD